MANFRPLGHNQIKIFAFLFFFIGLFCGQVTRDFFLIPALTLGVIFYRKEIIPTIRHYAFLKAGILFCCFAFISLLWSKPYSCSLAHDLFRHCRSFVFLPCIALLLFKNPKIKQSFYQGLMAFLWVGTICAFLYYFQILPEKYTHCLYKFSNIRAIPVSLLFALCSYLAWNRFLQKTSFWTLCTFILGAIYCLFLTQEKTGFLAFFVLIIFSIFSFPGKRKVFLASLMIGLFIVFNPFFKKNNSGNKRSSNSIRQIIATANFYLYKILSTRTAQAAPELDSSSYYRLQLLKQSLILCKEKPILGHGLTDLQALWIKKNWSYIGEELTYANKQQINTHNAYAYLLVRLGLVGCMLWGLWLFLLHRSVSHIETEKKMLFRGIFWVFLLFCFADPHFFLRTATDWLLILTSFLASREITEQ